ncbi:unnamed protein product, partial [Vitis vinifera]|uniref:Uncharacterized protein n=1 Tax=Vitis vinifera TaxID=29760 RepID=D7SPS1_VITVI
MFYEVEHVISQVSQCCCFLKGHTNLVTSSIRGHMDSLLARQPRVGGRVIARRIAKGRSRITV